jgi:spermidine synthase
MASVRGAGKYYIYMTLFFTGAAIMVLELLGTRVLGPYYGVSLYVWSSLISVTLVALAVGYWLGGKVADRVVELNSKDMHTEEADARAARVLYRLIMASGIAVLLIPIVAGTVLKLTLPLGIRAGALVSAFILFSIPLAGLGMVTPYAIKILTDKLKVVGATAGNLFAISTVGSFIGTVLTGFVLIPNLGTKKVIFLQAGILILLWVVWELMDRKFAAALLAIPILGFCIMSMMAADELEAADGFEVRHKTESFYGQMKVVDKGIKRWLTIDGALHTGIRKDTGLSLFPYSYYLELTTFMRPEAKDVLVVGLGAGSVTRRFEGLGMNVDSVEISPKVVDIARRFFGFRVPAEKVFIEDGRTYINNTDRKYDTVIFDAFSVSDTPPLHLITKEMFSEVGRVLKPGGILALNTFGFREGKAVRIPASIFRTMKEAFPHVRAFPTYKTSEFGNIVFLASDTALELRREVEGCDIEITCILLHEMLDKETTFTDSQGVVITDDYNPLEAWGVAMSESLRRDMLEHFPAEVLAL